MTDQPTNGRPRGPRPLTRAEERAEAIHTPTRSELLAMLKALTDLSKFKSDHSLSDANLLTIADLNGDHIITNADIQPLLDLITADGGAGALASVPEDAHEGWVEGIQLVGRKLRTVLESEGVTPIEAVGTPFDPNLHEAVVHQETTEYPDNVVIDEVQRGYRLGDRVLRPALVRVANNPTNPNTANPKEN